MVTSSIVLVVRAQRRLRVVGGRPAGAVEDRAVFADEDIAGPGVMERLSACTPACRQNVVPGGWELIIDGMKSPGWFGAMRNAPAGHVIAACGPTPDGDTVALISQCLTVPTIGSPKLHWCSGVPRIGF